MRKIIILSIAVLLIITSCSSETVVKEPTKPSEINTFNETIKDNYFIIEGEKYPIDQIYEEIIKYKDNSDLIKRKIVSYNKDERTSNYIRSYEHSDNLVVKEEFDKIEKTTYAYDGQDRIIEKRFFIRDALISEYKYEYGDDTKIIMTYRGNGELLQELISYYDEDQQLVKTETFSSQGNLTQKTNITYENEYIRKSVSKKNDEVIRKFYEKKNNVGDVIRQIEISNLDQDEPHTMLKLVDNVYDDNMRLIEKTQYTVSDQIDADILERLYFDKNNK